MPKTPWHLTSPPRPWNTGKHHKAYVDKLNSLIPGTEYEDMALEEIVRKAPAGGLSGRAGLEPYFLLAQHVPRRRRSAHRRAGHGDQ